MVLNTVDCYIRLASLYIVRFFLVAGSRLWLSRLGSMLCFLVFMLVLCFTLVLFYMTMYMPAIRELLHLCNLPRLVKSNQGRKIINCMAYLYQAVRVRKEFHYYYITLEGFTIFRHGGTM